MQIWNRAPASWVSLFAVTLTTHCDDTFRTAHTCPDDTLRRPISWPHITPWRRIPTWRHIVTTHSLRTHYPLTTHYPVTTHCDDTFPEDTLPPDDALPCDDALWRRIAWRRITPWRRSTLQWRHIPWRPLYSLTTLGNDAFPFILSDTQWLRKPSFNHQKNMNHCSSPSKKIVMIHANRMILFCIGDTLILLSIESMIYSADLCCTYMLHKHIRTTHTNHLKHWNSHSEKVTCFEGGYCLSLKV